FAVANQFVALDGVYGYSGEMGGETQGGGIEGWTQDGGGGGEFSEAIAYNAAAKTFMVLHKSGRYGGPFMNTYSADSLWGFRGLVDKTGSGGENLPADLPVLRDKGGVGLIKDGEGLRAVAAISEDALKKQYGGSLVNMVKGDVIEDEDGNGFTFNGAGAQLTPAIVASWESGGWVKISKTGVITTQGVHLNTPTFKIYKPTSEGGIPMSFSHTGLTIDVDPAKNSAIFHIDIPGATCIMDKLEADYEGQIVINGTLSINTPALNAAGITMNKLGLGIDKNTGVFGFNGVEASGFVDMKQLMGMDLANVSAEINSFAGQERYAFTMNINVFDMFQAEGELELKRINNGALIPNNLYLFGSADNAVIKLVPPVIVSEINGLGGGFYGLADTINGDFFAIPPLKLKITGEGSLIDVMKAKISLTVGPGYYKEELHSIKLLNVTNILDSCSWYVELCGEDRNYKGIDYQGLKIGGGLSISAGLPNTDNAWITVDGEVNASAYAGLNSYTNPEWLYLQIGADGKIAGSVQIPAQPWTFNRDIVILATQLDFALGGHTAYQLTNISPEDAIKKGLKEIAPYGGIAYTNTFLGMPFRVYYIIKDQNVGFEFGKWLGDPLPPFNPGPSGRAAGMPGAPGTQIVGMAAGDNIRALSPSALAQAGVTIVQSANNVCTVTIDNTVTNPQYLAFVLKPTTGTLQELADDLIIKKGSDAFAKVLATFDADGQLTNEGAANVMVTKDSVVVKLPAKATWTITGTAPYSISCSQATPIAAFDDNLTVTGSDIGSKITGTLKDLGTAKTYIVRSYLGNAPGGTDHLISQTDNVTASLEAAFPLSGTMAPSGTYHPTCVLLEEVHGDYDNNPATEDEKAYVTVDTYYQFTPDTVVYANSAQPADPTAVELTSTGNELLHAKWTEPSDKSKVDGYFVKIYKKDGGNWVDANAGYQVKKNVTAIDMALTVGGKEVITGANGSKSGGTTISLPAGASYRVGVESFHYTTDKKAADGKPVSSIVLGDGVLDSDPIRSSEVLSNVGGTNLPAAVYPVLTYVPPHTKHNGVKIISLNKAQADIGITVNSDLAATLTAIRTDTGAQLKTAAGATTLSFDTPAFDGSLMLKITAKEADGDVTTDYVMLQKDLIAPTLALTRESFLADYTTAAYSVTGTTEAGITVEYDVVDKQGVTTHETVPAAQDGTFAIPGNLGAETNRLLSLRAKDAAGNVSPDGMAIINRNTTPPAPPTSGGGKPVTYPVTKGAESAWTQGSGKPMVFTCDVPLAKFTGLNLDGMDVSENDYTAVSGSTIITLKPAYLVTLTPGTHTLKILFKGGVAETTFTIASWVNPFTDVKTSDWFYGDVNFVSSNGLMTGTGKTTFSPLTDTARSMVWAVLYRMAGSPGKTVAPTTWYSDAQKWAMAEAVSDGNRPTEDVTREQLATILYRYAKAAAVTADMSGFTDTGDISTFAKDGMSWAVANKILQGSAGKLNPQETATRAEVAAMLQRFAKLAK
ncbi:MAG: S-layer homology domain-containing protein, partial [Oscillospiraceae bacterium]